MLRDILDHQNLVTCEPDAKVNEVSKMMADRNVGTVMVLTNDKPRGILTDRDIVIRCVGRNIDVNDCSVEQIMSESLEYCKDTDGIFDCIQKMHKAMVRRMPVVNDQCKVVGIISFGDILRVLSKELVELAEANAPVEMCEIVPKLKAA